MVRIQWLSWKRSWKLCLVELYFGFGIGISLDTSPTGGVIGSQAIFCMEQCMSGVDYLYFPGTISGWL